MLNIGAKIAEGSQHDVYEDLDDSSCLIKLPKAGNRFSFDIVSEDIREMDTYFSRWTLPTEAVNGGNSYYIRQQYVSPAEHLRPSHLSSPKIKAEFKEMTEANKQAKKGGLAYDFLGTAGTSRAIKTELGITAPQLELFNVLIDTRNKLLMNGLLFRLRSPSLKEWINAHISTRLHRQFILRHFGIDIG